MLWLQIRRCPDHERRHRNPFRWCLLGGLVIVSLAGISNFLALASWVGYQRTWEYLIAERLSRPLYLHRASLQGQDLRGINMRGAILTEAILTKTNLQNAYLRDADLSGAKLAGANLTNADLVRARLVNADLRDATLSGSILVDANLVRANLVNARLEDVVLDGADFRMSDLTGSTAKLEDFKTVWSLWDSNLDDHLRKQLESTEPALFARPRSRPPQPRRSDLDIAKIYLDRASNRAQKAIDRAQRAIDKMREDAP
jgi:hypothetical protein